MMKRNLFGSPKFVGLCSPKAKGTPSPKKKARPLVKNNCDAATVLSGHNGIRLHETEGNVMHENGEETVGGIQGVEEAGAQGVEEGGAGPQRVGEEGGVPEGVEEEVGEGVGEGVGEEDRLVVGAPFKGMLFGSLEEVEEEYKRYGLQNGFGITRVQGVNDTDTGERIGQTWKCECWGDPQMRYKRMIRKRALEMDIGGSAVDDDISSKKSKSKKCHCTARLYACVNQSGRWEVRSVELQHYGHVPRPSQANLVKEYRMQSFHSNVRRRILNDREVGIPLYKIYDALANERDGVENMPFTKKDMAHVVDDARRWKMEGGDANALMKYFQEMRKQNSNFYYSHTVDEEGKLRDVFWADARSRVAYEEFGDVVCFDTTYLTNKYNLPFANFVGVNHHGQTILLGCALVASETCETFEWVFSEWLLCMNGKAPDAILTDQAPAMRRPLEEVMPNTRHRWCIWHILNKVPLRYSHDERYEEFKEDLFQCIYGSVSVGEFETKWAVVMREYGLVGDDWLEYMYENRYMWVPACMRGHFWAGMRTTQRVESINSFFDKFIFRHTTLSEFGERYFAAVKSRVADEHKADAEDEKWERNPSGYGYAYERVFRKIYTDAKFRIVQKQFERVSHCIVRDEQEHSENKLAIGVEDRIWIMPKGYEEEFVTLDRRMYRVLYDTVTKDALCDCGMFESQGIMCRHIIRVLDQYYVEELPPQYIVRRWRKDVVRKHTHIAVTSPDDKKRRKVKRRDKIHVVYDPLLDVADVHDVATEMVVNGIKKLTEEVQEWVKQNPLQVNHDGGDEHMSEAADNLGNVRVQNENANSDQGVGTQGSAANGIPNPTPGSTARNVPSFNLKDPDIPKRGRGRPKSNRFKSVLEPGADKANNPTKAKGKSGKGTSCGTKKNGKTKVPGSDGHETATEQGGTSKSQRNSKGSGSRKGKGKKGDKSKRTVADASVTQDMMEVDLDDVNVDIMSKSRDKLKVMRARRSVSFAEQLEEQGYGGLLEGVDDPLLTNNDLSMSSPIL